ncbi:vip36-like vesicular integral membrane protein [Vairimorpha apis BRL 01]|uniref:Vip36-like vesicular integral membrane protein n=1 Tax=Vairimorpha apis BRL 01 TaxID=1037528 RepID=T0LD22_9MICR|nr:vip36-like vesicular integral membrane protein [Vairimorpha apis BRL 01]
MLLLFLISILCNDSLSHLLLAPPYVDLKGKPLLVNLKNDYSILSYGGDQNIQLAYLHPGTNGFMIYKNQMVSSTFNIDIVFSLSNIHSSGASKGMTFFLSTTDNINSGLFYGIKDGFEGVCVVIDFTNKNKPYFSVATDLISEEKFNKKIFYEFYDDEKCTLKIKQDDKLSISIIDEYDEEIKLYDGKYLMPGKFFIGSSASNGENGRIGYHLRSIQPSHLKVVPKYYEKGEREGNSKIYLFCICFRCRRNWILFVY